MIDNGYGEDGIVYLDVALMAPLKVGSLAPSFMTPPPTMMRPDGTGGLSVYAPDGSLLMEDSRA